MKQKSALALIKGDAIALHGNTAIISSLFTKADRENVKATRVKEKIYKHSHAHQQMHLNNRINVRI